MSRMVSYSSRESEITGRPLAGSIGAKDSVSGKWQTRLHFFGLGKGGPPLILLELCIRLL